MVVDVVVSTPPLCRHIKVMKSPLPVQSIKGFATDPSCKHAKIIYGTLIAFFSVFNVGHISSLWPCLQWWCVTVLAMVVCDRACNGGMWPCLQLWWVTVLAMVLCDRACNGIVWPCLQWYCVTVLAMVVCDRACNGSVWPCLQWWWVTVLAMVVCDRACNGIVWPCLQWWCVTVYFNCMLYSKAYQDLLNKCPSFSEYNYMSNHVGQTKYR